MFGTYRFLLALMVIFTHLGGLGGLGSYAVFAFYMLSGYLMTLILHSSYGYSLTGLKKYSLNRFLRIFPLYWVSIIFSILIILLIGETKAFNYHKAMQIPESFLGVLKNISLALVWNDRPKLTPPSWALSVELFYYLCIGLGLSKNKLISICWLVISIYYHIYINLKGWGLEYSYFHVLAGSLPFSIGATLYFYKDYIAEKAPVLSHRMLPPTLVLLIIINWSIFGINRDMAGFYINLIFCALILVGLSKNRTSFWISNRWDQSLGALSYPMYLIHYQVGLLIIYLLQFANLEIGRPNLFLTILSIPIVIILSLLINHFIEKPIQKIREHIKTP